ncbi:hypothetical protein CBW53_09965 [Yersinia frederiksenii]|nr:hypothetical protein CBW53_09965 [Yersinia frederiksenii]
MHVRWLRSITRITYSSKLIGIHSLAALLQLELFGVYVSVISPSHRHCDDGRSIPLVLLTFLTTDYPDCHSSQVCVGFHF